MLRKHEDQILNYFIAGHTNAKAEAINNKIQCFITANQGTRDRDIFYFRLAKHFSAPSQNGIYPWKKNLTFFICTLGILENFMLSLQN